MCQRLINSKTSKLLRNRGQESDENFFSGQENDEIVFSGQESDENFFFIVVFFWD